MRWASDAARSTGIYRLYGYMLAGCFPPCIRPPTSFETCHLEPNLVGLPHVSLLPGANVYSLPSNLNRIETVKMDTSAHWEAIEWHHLYTLRQKLLLTASHPELPHPVLLHLQHVGDSYA